MREKRVAEQKRLERQPNLFIEPVEQATIRKSYKGTSEEKFVDHEGFFLKNLGADCTIIKIYIHEKNRASHRIEENKHLENGNPLLVLIEPVLYMATEEEFDCYFVEYMDSARDHYSLTFRGDRSKPMRPSESTLLTDC